MKAFVPKGMPSLAMILCVLVEAQPLFGDPAYWYREVVDFDPNAQAACGAWCSLAFDPGGNPAILYVDTSGALVVSRYNPTAGPGNEWQKTVVSLQNHLARGSIAFRPDGSAAVCYLAMVPMDPNYPEMLDGWTVQYAWQDAQGVWHLEASVDPPFPRQGWLSPGRAKLVFDAGGDPWVGYVANAFPLVVAAWALSASPHTNWEAEFIDRASITGYGCGIGELSLAVGPTGWPTASYEFHGPEESTGDEVFQLRCAWCAPLEGGESFGWQKEVARNNDPNVGITYEPWLAFDELGTPGIACRWATYPDPAGPDFVTFLNKPGGAWTALRSVAPIGEPISYERPDAVRLAYRVGFDNNPGISFYDNRDPIARVLYYAWLDPCDPNDPNGGWQTRAVDWIGDNGSYHSLASDPNGMPGIAYYDATEKRLMYAVASDRPDTYPLGITVSGDGTVLTHPNADPNWDDQYAYGTVVSLTAVPAAHWHFVRWRVFDPRYPGNSNYAVNDPNNPISVLMDRAREVAAEFDPNVYTLTITVTGNGSVIKDPNEDPNWGGYLYPTVVTLTADSPKGYHFLGWVFYDPNHPADANYAISDANEITHVFMDRDHQIGAVFECNRGGGTGLPLLAVLATLGVLKIRSGRNKEN